MSSRTIVSGGVTSAGGEPAVKRNRASLLNGVAWTSGRPVLSTTPRTRTS